MSTYEKPTPATVKQIAQVMKRYHPELHEAKVTVDVLMAFARRDGNGDPVGPALTLAGYACLAKIKIICTKDRAAGRGVAELLLDGDRWNELDDEQQSAVIDHELTHLELHVGENGAKRDDLDRPKLRVHKHDHQFGWFDRIVRRHGRDSIEWQQYEHFEEFSYKQLWLPFVEEGAKS